MTHPAQPIDEFLETLPGLRRDQLMVLVAAHSRSDPARETAWEAARAAISAEGLEADVDELRSMIIRWASRPANASTQWAEIPMADGLPEQDIRRAAGPALLDAAIAIYLGDALGIADHVALLLPWRRLWAAPIARGRPYRRPLPRAPR